MYGAVSPNNNIEPTKRKGKILANRISPLLLALIVVLAIVLRLYRIDAQSIWYDEGWSIHVAREPLGSALAQLASPGHTHPPAYYLLLMIWVWAFGSSVAVARGLSALLGTLTVWAVYRLGLRLFDRATGLTAALLLAIAPVHITYSQETRMYALLGLIYAILLTLSYDYAEQGRRWSWRDRVALIVVEVLAIYTHYFAALAILGVAIWIAGTLIPEARRGNPVPLRQWVGMQCIVLIAFSPQLRVALRRAVSYAPVGTTPPNLLPFITETWSFLMGGHVALYSREPTYAAISQACMAGTVLLSAWLLAGRAGKARGVAFLTMQGLLIPVLMFLLMRARPGFHPRYLFILIVPLVVLVARIAIALPRRGEIGKLSSALFMLTWLAGTGLAGKALLTDKYYARDDALSTTVFLQQHLAPSDLILMDADDWALRYYLENGDLADSCLNVGRDEQEIFSTVPVALRGRARAALVKWYQAESDKRGLLSYLLERTGTLVETRHLSGYTVLLYALDKEPVEPLSRQANISFGPLRLLEATVETHVPADEAVTMAITWRKEAEITRDCKATLSLVDQTERRLASSDRLMQDSEGAGTSLWPVGREATTYHTLNLSPGIAPLTYALRVGVYYEDALAGLDVLDEAGAPAGKNYQLAEIHLARARGRTHKMLDRARLGLRPLSDPTVVAPGLELRAVALAHERVGTGERLPVLLEWHSTLTPLPDYSPALCLTQGGGTLTALEAMPVYGRYPTSQWRPDEAVLDWRDLPIPLDSQPGPAELQIVVRGQAPITLGQIEIESTSHQFIAPQPQVDTNMVIGDFAELVGYDLPRSELVAGEDIVLTLYWHATAQSPLSYAVFTHLLNEEGRLIAQHDGLPAGGQRPTTGWIEGEFVVDRHTLKWLDPHYQGQAVIEVGFYDPVSGQRTLTARGDSRLLLASGIMAR